jgi:hypothetical protein
MHFAALGYVSRVTGGLFRNTCVCNVLRLVALFFYGVPNRPSFAPFASVFVEPIQPYLLAAQRLAA